MTYPYGGERLKKNYALSNEAVYDKSNILVESIDTLSELDHKIFSAGLYYMKPKPDPVNGGTMLEAVIPGQVLRELLDCKSGSLYTQIKNIETTYHHWKIYYADDENEKLLSAPACSLFAFNKGILTLRFNREIMPLIYNLQSNYTQYPLVTTMRLKKAAPKLHEMLQSHLKKAKKSSPNYKGIITLEIGFSELKFKLGCIHTYRNEELDMALRSGKYTFEQIEEMAKRIDDAYAQARNELGKRDTIVKHARWSDFKDRVLEPAVVDINSHEEIEYNVSYETVRSGLGGKSTSIIFTITEKAYKAEVSNDPTEDAILDMLDSVSELIEYHIKTEKRIALKSKRKMLEAAGYDLAYVERACILAGQQTEEIKSLSAWLIECIQRLNPGTRIVHAKPIKPTTGDDLFSQLELHF